MSEVIFPNGIRFEKPNPNAPEFVKGKISIKSKDLIEWLQENTPESGWVNLDLKKSKEKGTLYLQQNTWKPEQKDNQEDLSNMGKELPDINIDDIEL